MYIPRAYMLYHKQRWNSWMLVSGSQTRVFVWFSILVFLFSKMLFMLEVSCFADFLYGFWNQRWNSWTAFLTEVLGFRLKLSVFLFPRFSVLHKMLFMNRLEFSCFADLFVWISEDRVEHGFHKIRRWRTVKTNESFAKLMSKNSISGHCACY